MVRLRQQAKERLAVPRGGYPADIYGAPIDRYSFRLGAVVHEVLLKAIAANRR
jgi:hypothetical protein